MEKVFNFYNEGLFGGYLDDFYQTFGHFAISLGYNTKTGSMTIYVNFEDFKTSYHDDVLKHIVFKNGFLNNMKSEFPNLYIKMGKNIKSTFHLRRSPWIREGHCNTPVIFAYLIGTMEVKYN